MNARLLLIIASSVFVLLTGCSTLVPVPTVPPSTAVVAHASWARVLTQFVDEQGKVDFQALSDSRADLDRYVRFVADTSLDSLIDENEKLAHMINSYNALSMFNVIDSGIPSTHAGWNKLTFFVRRKFNVGGNVMSLYSFENNVIRPFTRKLCDPRVHFALNCLAASCPVLPRKPFTASALDTELERVSKEFFAQAKNFRIDAATGTVWLNELLSFYTEDFVPAHGENLIAYANRYAPQSAPPDYLVRFTPYNWTIVNQ